MISAAPPPLQQASVGVENPVDSGIIAIVDGLSCRSATDSDAAITIVGGDLTGTPFTTSANGGVRDSRNQLAGDSGTSVCVVGERAAAVAGNGFQVGTFQMDNGRDTNMSYLGPWVLGPSSRLTVNLGDDNVSFRCSFTWIERTLGKWEV